MSTPVQLQVEPISLPIGWSGSVVTGYHGPLVGGGPAETPPSTQIWIPLLESIVTDPSTLPGYELLKYSGAAELFKVRLSWDTGSIEVVCKRNRTDGFFASILGRLRQSRERRQFELGWSLCRAGIGTAIPLAIIERSTTPRAAWVITRFLAGIVDLDQIALTILPKLSGSRSRCVKHRIIESTVDLFVRLHSLKLHHRDLKATNILLTDCDGAEGGPHAWLVDLEGFRSVVLPSAGRRWQPLVRLAASLLSYESVTRTDYLRFLQAYLARTGAATHDWKARFITLSRRAGNYNRKARRRKTHKLDGYVARC